MARDNDGLIARLGKQSNSLEMAVRKYTPFIFVTIVSCCVGIVTCAVALGTDFWFHGSAAYYTADQTGSMEVKVRYGLFKGTKTTTTRSFDQQPFVEDHDLRIICIDGLCMFSCGIRKECREFDMRNVRANGTWDGNSVCRDGTDCKNPPRQETLDSDFLKFGLWLATIFFISAAIVFFTIGALLACYNSFRVPIQPIFSVLGLYIWNGIAAACVLFAMIVWGVVFGSTLKNNANVSETLHGNAKQNTSGRLGFSFWILLLAEILALLNIAILIFRSWKISRIAAVNHKIDPKLTSGDVLLF